MESGKAVAAKSYPDCQSWTDAYIRARRDIDSRKIPSVDKRILQEKRRILNRTKLVEIASIKHSGQMVLAVLLGALCGLCTKEVTSLRYEHIDFEARLIRVQNTKNPRCIPVPDEVMKRILAARDAKVSSRYVIFNSASAEKRCDPITIYRGLDRILKCIKCDDNLQVHFSWLHYTLINILIDNSVSSKTIDSICGCQNTEIPEMDGGTTDALEQVRRITNKTLDYIVTQPACHFY